MAKIKYIRTLEHRKHLSEALKGREVWNKGKVGVYSDEVCQRISNSLKGNIPWNKDKSPETLMRIALCCTGQKRTIEQRLHMSIAARCKTVSVSQECRKAQKKKIRACWQDREWVETHAKTIRHNIPLVKPTKPEKELFLIIRGLYPNQYKYTGDGTFSIGRYVPDFININGQKKAIELFGEYWHRGENPQNRIDTFAEYGFDCLVVWDYELKNKAFVIRKLYEFNQ